MRDAFQTRSRRNARSRRVGQFERLENRKVMTATLGSVNDLAFANLEAEVGNVVRVDSATDIDDGDFSTGNLSLREAIRLSNESDAIDTIAFHQSLSGSTITLTNGQLEIRGSVTIEGLGAKELTISGGGQTRIFAEVGSGKRIITINDVTLADGNNLTGAAGAFFSNGSDVTFNRVVMTGNAARNNASALEIAFGKLTINDSAIVNNLGSGAGALRLQDSQGTITNTTISGNGTRAISLFSPFTSGADRLSLTNVTIANNQIGGIEIVGNAGEMLVEYQNTIFAGNSGGNIVARGNNLAGVSIVSQGHNLLDDTPSGDAAHATATGDMRGTDPLLAPLADNNGPTPTHALMANSPAINAGDNDLAVDSNGVPLNFDQRGEGFARVSGDTVDIGAFESDNSGPQVESISINGGQAQRSSVREITVTFNEVIDLKPTDFVIEKLGSRVPIIPTLSTTIVSGKTVATLTFEGEEFVGGSLADGRYELVITDAIKDRSGNRFDGDNDGTPGGARFEEFFRLYGDINGDRTVNIIDFLFFRRAFNDPSAFDDAFDANGDSVINILDFFQFRGRFGKTL
ncbi:choice-of-anchor Q domain-containing protein [Rhodopirellula sp. MGV]|uniref:choice-of-anchor Q domain-containing protein n=1 Tax=Rhodopirellula sp. MGV TaxID=2023130 RepID=UPI00117B4539|nr:choice-of-anchor Q domain-containing protein [Rhodopirellula sp. MGV]